LLVAAFICSTIIPLGRDIVLGLIFYLGFWSISCNLASGGKAKMRLTAAFLLDNIVFLVLTMLYYGTFAIMVSTTTADSVLASGNVNISVGVPTHIFIIVGVAGLVYLVGMFFIISFVLRNYRDMGFSAMASVASLAVDKVTDKMGVMGQALKEC